VTKLKILKDKNAHVNMGERPSGSKLSTKQGR
jgi:hypothetical protein